MRHCASAAEAGPHEPAEGQPLLVGETWAFIWLDAIVEVVLLATIVRLAWRWRAEEVRGQVLR